MEHLHVERILVQYGARGVAPVETELAVILLNFTAPDFVAGEIEALQNAGAGEHPDVLAVRDGRGRRHVLLSLLVIAIAQEFLPFDLRTFAVDRPEIKIAALGDVHENMVAPNDGRRSGPGGKMEFPGDIFLGGPMNGKILFAADAVCRG